MDSQEPSLNDLLPELVEEVMGYVSDLKTNNEGAHLYSNYEVVIGYMMRLQEIHNQIALMEITGRADNELRRFRTMIVDPTIERLEKVAAFESRKITALSIERDLERK